MSRLEDDAETWEGDDELVLAPSDGDVLAEPDDVFARLSDDDDGELLLDGAA